MYDSSNVQLYYSKISGDSSSSGLIRKALTAVTISGVPWGETCIAPGEYYILLTGCGYTTEDVSVTIELIDRSSADYCSNAISTSLTGAGTVSVTATVDCHTIGESFGEDGSNMSCLFGPTGYKSTWIKLDFIDGGLKHDIHFQLTENTTAFPNQIRYRVNYGTCNGMTGGPCNSDALTEFTVNCMQSGTYYVQIITPENATGTVTLHFTTTVSPDQNCVPLNPNKPTANFTITGFCNDSIVFNNYSTQGADITYFWDFGDPLATDDTSHQFSSSYLYPITSNPQTYNVKLVVTNTANNEKDSVIIPITVYPRPSANITYSSSAHPLIIISSPTNWFANASNTITTPPTTYYWNFGSVATPANSTQENPTNVVFNSTGIFTVTLTVSNGPCSFTDSIEVEVLSSEPIFAGGPHDGFENGVLIACNTVTTVDSVYAGGPYDGFENGVLIACNTVTTVDSVYAGGPYDGFENGVLIACNAVTTVDSVYAGGPYDGFNNHELTINPVDCVPLPVINFVLNGTWVNNDIALKWSCDKEENVSKYELLRSLNGIDFEKIYENDAYHSLVPTSYNYLDMEVSSLSQNKFYYQVKAIDFDGAISYSNIIELERNISANMITVYPNPTQKLLYIKHFMKEDERVNIIVYDINGKTIIIENQNWYKGLGITQINVSELANGIYELVFSGSTWTKTVKIMVEK